MTAGTEGGVAAALAIWRSALPAKRKATGALMISVALTAFVTGITKPLEYAFAYVAFPLYAVHAVLTGIQDPRPRGGRRRRLCGRPGRRGEELR